MPLLNVIIYLIVVGILLWLVNQYLPIEETIKRIINIVVIVAIVIWLLSLFIGLGSISTIRIGRS